MAGRVIQGLGVAIGLAAVGCALPGTHRTSPSSDVSSNSVVKVALPDNSSRTRFDNPSPNPSAPWGGGAEGDDGVVPAGYSQGLQPPPSGGGTFPSIPTAPGTEARPPTGASGYGSDPHRRSLPTASGAFLNLAPGETATDRAVELMKRIETLGQENLALRDRIRTLEANGVEREQALRETLRDTERATVEIQKARLEFEGLRAEMTKLRDRARRVEDDEIETMKAIVDALKGLLAPPPIEKNSP